MNKAIDIKKLTKRLASLVLAAISVCAIALPMFACDQTPSDPKTTPLTFSIDTLDGNFNPFFVTSANDSKIVEQTQIRMLTTDASGKLICGEKQPTVALSYTETMKNGEEITTNAKEATSTEYEFVIKKDIKFSDGTPLTIKDVLFNLYVYLDPMYKGPATISSAKIQGLNAYRWQDLLASDDQNINEGEAKFYAEADARIVNVINYLSDKTVYPVTEEISADIALIKKLFFEEAGRNEIKSASALDSQLLDALTSQETVNTLREELAAEIRSAYYDDLKEKNNGLLVKTISGITTSTKVVDDEPHDVLKITVNGVASKDVWNFAFYVAPMHYYAGETYADKANGTDYFGVEYNNKEFFQDILQDSAKNALPMGAGAYQASDSNGMSTDVDGDDFYNGRCVYFTRNNYFNTVGLNNAKIKNLQYKVIPNDQILDSLINNEIHIGSSIATLDDIKKTGDYDYLEAVTYASNRYAYVGINPKAVPDIEVRQAIMKAIDTALIMRNDYSADLMELVHRPLSIKSWAYPKVDDKNVGRHEKVKFSRSVDEICSLVESAGYYRTDENSVYGKDGKTLKFTFTILNEVKDDPVYAMFTDAAEWLNENCGFDITVATDVQAISKLETGDLQVWMATRLFGVDPDLYQFYHKDSLDTNVKNLGYSTIFADTTEQFSYEKGIIKKLSAKIEAGRETINFDERKRVYAEALDLIMELCVELPVYQQKDMIVYNKKLIKGKTINKQNASPTLSVFNRIWEVEYN